MAKPKQLTYVHPGDVVKVQLPYSEVCMHMKVAGQIRSIEVLANSAQILNDDGSEFSFPITYGEAGIYSAEFGYYVWRVVD
jgi:hypothetical protein